jgi:hypothetical protein
VTFGLLLEQMLLELRTSVVKTNAVRVKARTIDVRASVKTNVFYNKCMTK